MTPRIMTSKLTDVPTVAFERPREQRARNTKRGAVPLNPNVSPPKLGCIRIGGLRNLQHLDEGDAEIEIRQVAANQAKAVEDTDWYNGPHVQFWCHSHKVSSIENSAEAGKDLSCNGCESEVVAGQKDGCMASQRLLARFNFVMVDPRYSARSRIHLLRRITAELRIIHALHSL